MHVILNIRKPRYILKNRRQKRYPYSEFLLYSHRLLVIDTLSFLPSHKCNFSSNAAPGLGRDLTSYYGFFSAANNPPRCSTDPLLFDAGWKNKEVSIVTPDLVGCLGDGLCGLHVSCKKLRLGNLNPHSKSLCFKTFPWALSLHHTHSQVVYYSNLMIIESPPR
jgi:hypothetical protein